MRFEFLLADLAEGMVEGELVDWLVAVGDEVKLEQPVAEVMTDKATVVIPSPVKGKVLALSHEAGDVVEVGAVLMVFDAEGEIPVQRAHAGHQIQEEAVEAPLPDIEVEKEPAPKKVSGIEKAALPAASENQEEPHFQALPAQGLSGKRVLAAPATRRLARELGIDIATVRGSGPGGRVLPGDLSSVPTSSVGSKAPREKAPVFQRPSFQAPATEGSERREKIRGLRRAIFDAMTRSKSLAAHFTYVEEVDCEALVLARKKLNQALEGDAKLTYLPFIAKAVLLALPRYPKMNASVDDENMEVIYKPYFHLGIASATPPGLVVPVIRDADRLSILELSKRISDLGTRSRDNQLKPDELKGSTFTITSLGKLGGVLATPIINHPEVAILGIHQMKKQAVVVDDEIVIRQRMNIALSFDHRLIDGHEGAAFAQEIKRYLETPELMMLEMI